jgi:hypothetical protein
VFQANLGQGDGMSTVDELNALITSGRITFDVGNPDVLRRELLGTPPARAVVPGVQKLIVALCGKVPALALRVSSLYRNGESHHAEGRALDIGNEEVAATLLPLVATQAFVNELQIDEIIFDATLIPQEMNGNRYNFDAGQPHVYSAPTLREHRNHIHFSVRG